MPGFYQTQSQTHTHKESYCSKLCNDQAILVNYHWILCLYSWWITFAAIGISNWPQSAILITYFFIYLYFKNQAFDRCDRDAYLLYMIHNNRSSEGEDFKQKWQRRLDFGWYWCACLFLRRKGLKLAVLTHTSTLSSGTVTLKETQRNILSTFSL